jgi:glucose/arabinose dehydrogenase
MRSPTMGRTRVRAWLGARLCLVLAIAANCGGSSDAANTSPPVTPTPPSTPTTSAACDNGNGGLNLPAGFCASVFADKVGAPRHIVVTASGDVYTMLSGGAVLALRDTNGDGHADVRATFGRSGNSGLYLRGNNLYADNGTFIVRYTLTPGTLAPASAPDTLVKGLPTGGHSSRSIAVDASGNMFIGVGSATNICESGTKDPCNELPTRAGVWKFDATTKNQAFSAGARFATGIRNAVGMAIHPTTNLLFVTQHGRDNLFQSYPQLFNSKDGAESPAEEIFQVNAGDDFGWPYCYFDQTAGHRVLGPEYGGNRSTIGRCSTTKPTVTAFPGHWAPNGLTFYAGTNFPEHYRNGAFVAFHGSWNRAPEPQAGYLVAFVPASGNSLSSSYEVFADGLAAQAAHRPVGVAVDSIGVLYITDDAGGRIWRVVHP